MSYIIILWDACYLDREGKRIFHSRAKEFACKKQDKIKLLKNEGPVISLLVKKTNENMNI